MNENYSDFAGLLKSSAEKPGGFKYFLMLYDLSDSFYY